MPFKIIAVGSKMPDWCSLATTEYLKRLSGNLPCQLIEIIAATRHKSGVVEKYKEEEGRKIMQKIAPDDHVVALEVQGSNWSTENLAQQLDRWKASSKPISFLIGGPDGLWPECVQRANQKWSLSPLTLPHPLVRVVLLEQLYRAQSILSGHPYHRG